MSPSEVRFLEGRQIVELLMSGDQASEEAVRWIAALVSDDATFEGVKKLRRRFVRDVEESSAPTTTEGRHKNANTVYIDPDRFRAFFWRRRLPLTAVGPMFGRCAGWASVIVHKGHAGYWALDELATSMDMRVDDLIEAIASEEELRRVS